MQKKIVWFILFSLVLLNNVHSQSITFEKLYLPTGMNAGWSVKQLPDSGYIIVGSTDQSPNFSERLLLIRTDKYGDTLWQKTICGREGRSVELTADGGFIIAATASNCLPISSTEIQLVKTDSLGNIIWNKAFGNSGVDNGKCVINTKDSNYVFCSSTSSYDNLIKTDTAGNIIWARYIPVNMLLSVKQTYDDGYIIAGYTGVFQDPYYIAKLDTGGFVQWYKTFYSASLDVFTDIVQMPDSGFVTTSDLFQKLYKLNAQGDSLWTSNTSEGGLSLSNTTDGGFIAAGGSMGLHLIKWDSALSIKWTKYFDPYSNNLAVAFSVQQTSDGGYIACGRAQANISVQDYEVYLVKTDSLGNVYTGINETEKNKTFAHVYPNPMQTEAQLLIENFHYSALKNPGFALYDLTGKQITAVAIKQWPFIIKRNSLQSGMYFYKVSDEKGLMLSGKIIIR